MNPGQNVVVNLILAGKNRFLTGIAQAKAGLHGLATQTTATGKVMTLGTRRTWLFNQALFTMRRLTYGVTLGLIAAGAVILKWGFDFNSQMNNARVGMEGFIKTSKGITDELTAIYRLAAITPFNFPEILQATRRLIPYNSNLQEVNQTIEALTNTLSAGGFATNKYLTAASIQISHILALGRVTGQQLNALARDNIPLIIMLAHYYGVTTARATEMVHQGLVPAADAMKALIQYQHQAGYEGKNFAMATRTLSGAWATFQDIMRFAAGRSEAGLFNRVRKALIDIDLAMLPLIKGNKPITIYMIAQALDTALSPKTHAILYLFNFFYGILQGIIGSFMVFFKVLTTILRPLGTFGEKTHTGTTFMRLFGIAIGISIGLMIIWRLTLYSAALAVGVYTAAVWLADAAQTVFLISLYAIEAALFWPVVLAASILILVGILAVLYFKWDRFHKLVDRFGRWLYAHEYMLTFIPIFGPFIVIIVAVIKYWDRLTAGIRRAYNMVMKFKNAVSGPAKFIGRGARFAGNLLQGKLAGGSPGLAYAGNYLVGERGAEIVHLPRGAAVSPNAALGGLGSFALVIEPAPVILDGRTVGEVVFKHRLDRVARR
jgi:tape measure domain-containing protein